MGEQEAKAYIAEFQEDFREGREVASNWSSGYREIMLSSDTQAIEFAKLIIQSLLLIHGGAIVAVPTFWTTFPTVVQNQSTIVWCIFAIFVIGLFCAVLAAALAFHCLANRAEGNQHMASAANHQAWLYVYRMREAGSGKKMTEIIQTTEANALAEAETYETFMAAFRQQRWWAILLLWASIACLILGTIAGLLLVSS